MLSPTNVSDKLGSGLAPDEFIRRMTRNREKFEEHRAAFTWNNDHDRRFFEQLPRDHGLLCLIICADWCGDVVRNVPAILRINDAAAIATELFVIEDHPDFIDQFLVMGGRSIPVVLYVRADGEVVGRWGPRPRHVQEVLEAFKAAHPDPTAPSFADAQKLARAEIGARYGQGPAWTWAITRELRALLTQALPMANRAVADGSAPERAGFVTGIDHVQLAAPPGCEARARHFFQDVLQLQEIAKPAELLARGGVWFSCGPQQLHIGVEPSFAPSKKAHPALRVRHFEDLLARLQVLGIEVRRDDLPGTRRAFVDDPFGNRLELVACDE